MEFAAHMHCAKPNVSRYVEEEKNWLGRAEAQVGLPVLAGLQGENSDKL